MKTTLITGAATGIGMSLAHKLAQKNHNLLLIDGSSTPLRHLCAVLSRKFNIHTNYLAVDLSQTEAAGLAFDEAEKRGLDVNLLINNAGIESGGEFCDLPLLSEIRMMHLNMEALVAFTYRFLPTMKNRRNGTIVNIGSLAAFTPIPYMAVYAATTSFVRSFTLALIEECKPYDVKVMLFSLSLKKSGNLKTANTSNVTEAFLTEGVDSQTSDEAATSIMEALEKGAHYEQSASELAS